MLIWLNSKNWYIYIYESFFVIIILLILIKYAIKRLILIFDIKECYVMMSLFNYNDYLLASLLINI